MISHVINVDVVEAIVVRESLILAAEVGFNSIEVETDSIRVPAMLLW